MTGFVIVFVSVGAVGMALRIALITGGLIYELGGFF